MRFFSFVAILLVLPGATLAHFPYVHLNGGGDKRALHAYFGHGVEPTDAKYFPRLEGARVSRVTADGKVEPLSLAPTNGSLASEPLDARPAAYVFEKDQGVIRRNGDYLLTNYAKTFSGPDAWVIDASKHLRLDVTPERTDGQLTLTVRWECKAAANVDVVIEKGGMKQEGKTNADGQFIATLGGTGLYIARAWRIDETPGERNGRDYDDVRYYTTVTLDIE